MWLTHKEKTLHQLKGSILVEQKVRLENKQVFLSSHDQPGGAWLMALDGRACLGTMAHWHNCLA